MLNRIFYILLAMHFVIGQASGQRLFESYSAAPKDSLKIGDPNSYLSFIQKGYTLSMPEKRPKGTLIFLEGSKFDQKNMSATQMYEAANTHDFAVLSVSTEIPLDFYFIEKSMLTVSQIIEEVFMKYELPPKNIFFLGVGLSGHRALKYIEYAQKSDPVSMHHVSGVVICDSPLDWYRQYNEGMRDIRINCNPGSVWEGNLTTYLLREHLGGTPESNSESFFDFSIYSYYDKQFRNIASMRNLPIITYMQVDVEYWLEKKCKTPIDNNGPDMVGLIAALKLAGNEDATLKVIYPHQSKSDTKNVHGTWLSVDKNELMKWILLRTN